MKYAVLALSLAACGDDGTTDAFDPPTPEQLGGCDGYYEKVPVEAGQEELDVFLHLRAITDYTREHSRKIIHAPIAGNRVRRVKRANSKES